MNLHSGTWLSTSTYLKLGAAGAGGLLAVTAYEHPHTAEQAAEYIALEALSNPITWAVLDVVAAVLATWALRRRWAKASQVIERQGFRDGWYRGWAARDANIQPTPPPPASRPAADPTVQRVEVVHLDGGRTVHPYNCPGHCHGSGQITHPTDAGDRIACPGQFFESQMEV